MAMTRFARAVQVSEKNEVRSRVLISSKHVWASMRIVLGLTFFWAFIDKLAGLKFSTATDAGWLDGGNPTYGFLKFGTDGPLTEFYGNIAGAGVTDTLFMAGLAGVGIAMILGIGVRIAAMTGALMYLLMWSAHLPPENHPFLDQHIIGAIAMVSMGMVSAGRTWGLGRRWERVPLAKKYPILR